MIVNGKKVHYIIMELTRQEILSLLMGGEINQQQNASEMACLFHVYCSNPATSDEVIQQLTLQRKEFDEEEKSHLSSPRRC